MLVETQFALKEWFTARDRNSRLEWWIYFAVQFAYPTICVLTLAISYTIIFFMSFLGLSGDTFLGNTITSPIAVITFILCAIFFFILGWKFFIVTVGRLHDTNRSGWNILWLIIPGGILYIIIVCGMLEGTDKPNKYGNPPVYQALQR